MFELITSDLTNLILNFVRMLFIILVIAHWSACLFYFFGTFMAVGETTTWIIHYGL
jgi:hypothetical protein